MNYPYRYDNPPLQEFSKKLNGYSFFQTLAHTSNKSEEICRARL